MALDDGGLRRMGPVDVVPVLDRERAELLALLGSLDTAGWSTPTECPGWTVQGIALHILGDDLSLLSRQRDEATNSLQLEGSLPAWDGAPAGPLDRFNQRWVHAATFLSPPALMEMLALSGTWTRSWYEHVDPHATGEPVLLFGSADPAPYWQIAARELLERWVHHLQIRRALDLDPGPMGHPPVIERIAAVVIRALAELLTPLVAAQGTQVTVALGAPTWTLVRDGDRWDAYEGAAADSAVRLAVEPSAVPALLSRGMERPEAEAVLRVDGAQPLAGELAATVVAVVSR